MREGEPQKRSRDLTTTKNVRTLALVVLALAAQVTIVALAPSGKARTRVPPPHPFPFEVIAEGPANVELGSTFDTAFLYDFTCFSCSVSISGRLEEGATYFEVSPNFGTALIGADGDAYTIPLAGDLPGFPLAVREVLGTDQIGPISETLRVDVADAPPVVYTSPILSTPELSDVSLSYRRPIVSTSKIITSTWLVSPNSQTITQTHVFGTLHNGVYRSVVAKGGLCESVLAGFVCRFDDLGALQASGTITTTLDATAPGNVREAIRVATLGDVFTYTATNRVLLSDVVEPIEVGLEVKPFSRRGNINTRSRGKTPFAIVSTSSFDVTEEVESSSLRFGPTGLEDSVSRCFTFDLRHDGMEDLLCLADLKVAGFEGSDTEAVVTGETFDGRPIRGTDEIRTLPPR